jgi:hypothetical protein
VTTNTLSAYTQFAIYLSPSGQYQVPFTITAAGTVVTQGGYGVANQGVNPAILFNAGLVDSTSPSGIGVKFADGGYVENSGTIIGSGSEGVYLSGGGTVSNTGTAAILGQGIGVFIPGGAGTVFNAGTIANLTGGAEGVVLGHGGVIDNDGTAAVMYGSTGAYITGQPGTVLNAGTITGTDFGVKLGAGGTVSNAEAATISGGIFGVVLDNTAGTVINAGIIYGASDGIDLQSGGYLYNSGTAALISSTNSAIYVSKLAGTVVNQGSIIGALDGVRLQSGGTVSNQESGLISGTQAGVNADGGTVFNAGTITSAQQNGVIVIGAGLVENNGAASAITGYNTALYFRNGAGIVLNDGTIASTNATGAGLYDGGTLVNTGIAAAITGYRGVDISGAAGTVINAGQITGTGEYGIQLFAGGTISNDGAGATISGGRDGIQSRSTAASVFNTGTISGASEDGVYLAAGGTISNTGAGALITGADVGAALGRAPGVIYNSGTLSGGFGVELYGPGQTLINAGTVTGQYRAVYLSHNGYDDVVIQTGGVFIGNVTAEGADERLDLAGTGSTVAAIGGQFSGFSTLAFDPKAVWTVSGDATELAALSTITGFNFGDTLDVTGFAATSAAYTMGVGLVLTNASASYLLAVSASSPGATFTYASDGNGGTQIWRPGTHTLSTQYNGQLVITGNAEFLSPFTITQTGAVTYAGTAVYSALGGVTLYNDGTVLSSGSIGVDFSNGGTVVNTAYIYGGVAAAYGDVTNAGTITGGPFGGVQLENGGTVTNTGTASVIAGSAFGVIGQGEFTITNAGSIIGGGLDGIYLGDGGTITNTGGAALISGGAYGVFAEGMHRGSYPTLATTLFNSGNITGGSRDGVYLGAGGSVSNAASGQITGYDGIYINHTYGSVDNAGTITGNGMGINGVGTPYDAGYGIRLRAGGIVTNSGTAATIYGNGNYGVLVQGLAGTVINDGTITSGGRAGVELQDGGYIANLGTAAYIAGDPNQFGIYVGGAAGTVLNQGIINDYIGVSLYDGGTITNSANAVIGGYNPVRIAYGPGGSNSLLLVNDGTIAETNAAQRGGKAVYLGNVLAPPGSVLANVVNTGTILGGQLYDTNGPGSGIELAGGGTVANNGAAAFISGQYGIDVTAGYGTVINSGTILGGNTVSTVVFQGNTYTSQQNAIGVLLESGGMVSNAAGGFIGSGAQGVQVSGGFGQVYNSGTIMGLVADGVTLGGPGGYVYNGGAGALIFSGSIGVDMGGMVYGAVVNAGGTITGGQAGIRAMNGGYAYAGNIGGTITGGYTGIYLADYNNNVFNSGLIAATGSTLGFGYGIALGGFNAGGGISVGPFPLTQSAYGGVSLLTNSSTGTISAPSVGIVLEPSGNAVVENYGVITGAQYGIFVQTAFHPQSAYQAIVQNHATGTISGSLGVRLNNTLGVVENAGTISGVTYAVRFDGSGSNDLVVFAGAVFDGAVAASASATNQLELASNYGNGTLAGIGSQFTGFGTIKFDPGADWLLSGNAAGLAAGELIQGFAPGDTLDITDITATSVSFLNNTLALYNGVLLAGTLDLAAENVTNGSFALTSDGGAGVDITRLPPNPNVLSTYLSYGVTLTPGGEYQSPYTVTNTGTINAYGASGIYSAYAASVTIYGTVGGFTGIDLEAGGTVVADGTISGGPGYAIQFAGGPAVLVVEPGADFIGQVTALDAAFSSLLDLQTSGIFGGIGTEFLGFQTIDLGTAQDIAGNALGLADGETLQGFAAQDGVDITDLVADSESVSHGTLTLYDAGLAVGSLVIAGANLSSTDFTLASDGGAGTEIFALARTIISTTLDAGVTLSPAGAYNTDLTVTSTGAVFENATFAFGIYANTGGGVTLAQGATVASAGGSGIALNGGNVSNAGLISGSPQGIRLWQNGGFVFNAQGGTIAGGQYGVAAYYGVNLDNQGLIQGGVGGFYALGMNGALSTLENGGTIAGGAEGAVVFRRAADLIVDPGAVFIGGIAARAAGPNLLELTAGASAGTLTGIGTSITGFTEITIDPGAAWTLAGDAAGFTAGQIVTGFATLDITDLKADSETFANGVLTLAEAGVVAGTIIIGTHRNLSSADFSVAGDSGNGTDVTLIPKSPYIIATSLSTGVVLSPGGTYASPLTITNTGAVNAYVPGNAAIYDHGQASLLNQGTAASNGRYVIWFDGGGAITNSADGYIEGRIKLGFGAYGTFINAGTFTGAAQINGSADYISNASTGLIQGTYRILEQGSHAIVINAGTIDEQNTGIGLGQASTLINEARAAIISQGNGVGGGQGATVTNAGYIYGGNAGVSAYGTVFNSGTILGGTGILHGGGSTPLTVSNAGTIASTGGDAGVAINFGAAPADLIITPGAVFTGAVQASAGYANTLDLAAGGHGALTGIGTQFSNFNTLNFDTGATWSLTGITAGFNLDTVTGFIARDAIDITDLTGAAPATVTLGAAETLSVGGVVLTFAGDAGVVFNLAADGQGGAIITDDQPCFAGGTHILTPDGEKRVEDIQPGDTVITVRENGPLTARVIWTGRRTVYPDRHPEPELALPVRVLAGAISPGVPERDLRLSPHHALYLDGCLFEAISLVNGVTIFQEARCARVTYHHVELEAHDILLAEGMACESYLDTGNRNMFEGAVMVAHPDFRTPAGAAFCAPMIREGGALEAMRARLAARHERKHFFL